MPNCTLKGFMSPEVSYINHLGLGYKPNFRTTYSYNVKYSTNLTCKGELTAETVDKTDNEKFKIKVVIVGVFEYKEGADKDLLHIDTFKALFPYARTLVSTITMNCGIPPIILPDIDIEDQNIYRIGRE